MLVKSSPLKKMKWMKVVILGLRQSTAMVISKDFLQRLTTAFKCFISAWIDYYSHDIEKFYSHTQILASA